MGEVNDWGIAALERAAAGLACKTAVHICYGYGIEANTKWKETLGAEWKQYEEIFPALDKSRIGQVSLECAGSKVPMSLIRHLRNKEILVGVIDVASTRVETAEDVAATLKSALQHADVERLQACTNCGLAPFPRTTAFAKLQALGAGAALARRTLT
jgi:5-methyltetrahydropteroyltriglutamate--homocysteine methyltransferase